MFDLIKSNYKYSPKNSATWFMNNVRAQMGGVGPMKILGDNLHRQTNTPPIGKMIFFTYDPKGKKELPFYDNFPLVLPFGADKTSFIGLNFHYLMPRTRLILLNKLMEFASNDRLDDKTKIEVSWRLLSNASKYPEVAPSVKKYLFGHVKSRMVEIPVDDMPIAIFLPCERFKKQSAEYVWQNSAKG